MSDILTPSLASWRDAHGFGILCIRTPAAERFMIVPSDDSPARLRGISPWEGLAEAAFRARLRKRAELSPPEVDEAVALARRWATTFDGSGGVFWPPAA